jgi:hypothetical protein
MPPILVWIFVQKDRSVQQKLYEQGEELLEKESRTRGAIGIWEQITRKRDPYKGRQGKKHRRSVSEKESERERDRKVRVDKVAV